MNIWAVPVKFPELRWLQMVMACFCPAVPTNRASWGYLFTVNCSHIHVCVQTHKHVFAHAHTHRCTHAKMLTSTQCQTIQLTTIKSIWVITQRLFRRSLPVHHHNCNYGKATMMCNYSSLSLLWSDVMSVKMAAGHWDGRELHYIILI